jgi:hypothetical protein
MKKKTNSSKVQKEARKPSSSQPISAKSEKSSDWRSQLLTQIRKLIQQADPEAVEEAKWEKPSNPAGVPTWSHGGIICTGETYKDKVKLTFAKGAALPDLAGLFNSSLEGNTRRAIDFHEGDKLNEKAIQVLIRAAVSLNTGVPNSPPAKTAKRKG